MQDMSTGNADDSKASPYCSAKPERYLSGYLNKLSHKGLIRSWKKRWIIYHDPTCQLRCFASSQDSEPLEVISIRDAVFSFDSSKERQHVFKIMYVSAILFPFPRIRLTISHIQVRWSGMFSRSAVRWDMFQLVVVLAKVKTQLQFAANGEFAN